MQPMLKYGPAERFSFNLFNLILNLFKRKVFINLPPKQVSFMRLWQHPCSLRLNIQLLVHTFLLCLFFLSSETNNKTAKHNFFLSFNDKILVFDILVANKTVCKASKYKCVYLSKKTSDCANEKAINSNYLTNFRATFDTSIATLFQVFEGESWN